MIIEYTAAAVLILIGAVAAVQMMAPGTQSAIKQRGRPAGGKAQRGDADAPAGRLSASGEQSGSMTRDFRSLGGDVPTSGLNLTSGLNRPARGLTNRIALPSVGGERAGP